MSITINTPALLFPAISLIMLAYTNRFLALSSVVRNLHEKYLRNETSPFLKEQINNLRFRLKLVRRMQFLGVLSFILALLSMYFIYIEYMSWANACFAAAMILFSASLVISLIEILRSTRALELELSDMEGLEDPNLVDYIRTFGRKGK
ncbi:MAG: DUF2721 domain-containing protein [Chitinophagales bacterium]|nr:DUF2721 domain-containing protein [Chitinophagales bacterium]HAE14432.1 DUF2721 domain-containing protein [Bacteroidota bacterium]MCB9022153.1 DUF2721 domain-containing protein [Chitinophagales bacterium]MCB9031948.1 DUF2721 domain-containing protein [Chitinophagales bacterium]HAE35818.1 DUF2721 domain-containing protein [Bacteroidota bacterium]